MRPPRTPCLPATSRGAEKNVRGFAPDIPCSASLQRYMMNIDQFRAQSQAFKQRVQALYRQKQTALPQIILSRALEELDASLEIMRAVESAFQQQNDQLLERYAALEAELHQYRELFTHAPAAYLVTKPDGTIRQANQAAGRLLQTSERLLVGRSLAHFVAEGQRRSFRAELARLAQVEHMPTWKVTLHPQQHVPFTATFMVAAERNGQGKILSLRWLLLDASERPQKEAHTRLLMQEERLRTHLEEPEQTRFRNGSQTPGLVAGEHRPAAPAQSHTQEDSSRQPVGALRRRYHFLAQTIRLLVAPLDVTTLLAHIARLAVPAFADLCIFDLFASDAEGIRCLAAIDNPANPKSIYQSQGHYLRDARQGHDTAGVKQIEHASIDTSDSNPPLRTLALNPQQRKLFSTFTPNASMTAPIKGLDSILGACIFVVSEPRPPYGIEDLALVEELASSIGATLSVGTWGVGLPQEREYSELLSTGGLARTTPDGNA